MQLRDSRHQLKQQLAGGDRGGDLDALAKRGQRGGNFPDVELEISNAQQLKGDHIGVAIMLAGAICKRNSSCHLFSDGPPTATVQPRPQHVQYNLQCNFLLIQWAGWAIFDISLLKSLECPLDVGSQQTFGGWVFKLLKQICPMEHHPQARGHMGEVGAIDDVSVGCVCKHDHIPILERGAERLEGEVVGQGSAQVVVHRQKVGRAVLRRQVAYEEDERRTELVQSLCTDSHDSHE
mmetsp:Transcript_51959/g.92722  ORF Transcript_51959/g.92722 Transcript_51959/m.92722 type:complete len:236 (+) Transcript_51959:3350-4057(+)